MTISEIRSALNDELDAKAEIYGETNELIAAHNVIVTDSCATVLETVNPNHDYPPVNK